MKIPRGVATCLGVLGTVALASAPSCSDHAAYRPRPMTTIGESGHGGNAVEDSAAGRGGSSAGLGGDESDPTSLAGIDDEYATRMQMPVNLIRSKLDVSHRAGIDALADKWLRQLECPVDFAQLRCP